MIQLQPHLSDEQIIALHQHYKDEMMAREEQLRRHPLYHECKTVVNMMKNEIYAQLRKSKSMDS